MSFIYAVKNKWFFFQGLKLIPKSEREKQKRVKKKEEGKEPYILVICYKGEKKKKEYLTTFYQCKLDAKDIKNRKSDKLNEPATPSITNQEI